MNIISDGASHVHGHRAEVLGSRQKSPPIIVDPAGIPADIKLLPRWVNWCWKWNGKKWDKPPLQLDAKTLASSTKPETWSSFDEALESHQREHVGIGFVLNGDGIVGIDLDNCRDPETGQIADWARGYITRLATYCEVSPSGTGVKLLIRGRLPGKFQKKFTRPNGEVEVYSTGRYFTLTGQRLPDTPAEIRENQSGLNVIFELLGSWKKQNTNSRSSLEQQSDGDSQPNPRGRRGDDRQTALAALAVLSPDCGYDEWLRIGQALHSVDSSPSILAEWDNWSRGSGKYVEGEPTGKWNSFHANGGVTLGTLCKMADDTGRTWRPKSNKSQKESRPPLRRRPRRR